MKHEAELDAYSLAPAVLIEQGLAIIVLTDYKRIDLGALASLLARHR